jgi:hypothetical protein
LFEEFSQSHGDIRLRTRRPKKPAPSKSTEMTRQYSGSTDLQSQQPGATSAVRASVADKHRVIGGHSKFAQR